MRDHGCFPALNSVLKIADQLTFTCSKSAIETLEKDVRDVQS